MLRLNRIDVNEIKHMRTLFDVIDSDGSGEITFDELTKHHEEVFTNK